MVHFEGGCQGTWHEHPCHDGTVDQDSRKREPKIDSQGILQICGCAHEDKPLRHIYWTARDSDIRENESGPAKFPRSCKQVELT